MVKIKRISDDRYGNRRRYRVLGTNQVLVSVDGVLHTTTEAGEPLYPYSKKGKAEWERRDVVRGG